MKFRDQLVKPITVDTTWGERLPWIELADGSVERVAMSELYDLTPDEERVKMGSVLGELWAELDRVTKEIMEWPPSHDEEIVMRKGYARGLAYALVPLMSPFFRTTTEIAAEAKRRYDAKQAGEVYVTNGLQGSAMTVPEVAYPEVGFPTTRPDGKPWPEGMDRKAWEKYVDAQPRRINPGFRPSKEDVARVNGRKPVKTEPPKPVTASLSMKDLTGLRQAWAAFPADQRHIIAASYKLTVEQAELLVNQS